LGRKKFAEKEKETIKVQDHKRQQGNAQFVPGFRTGDVRADFLREFALSRRLRQRSRPKKT